MKYDSLLRRCNLFYKMALNAQDLIRQALTDPDAWDALTDYLIESGQISPEVIENSLKGMSDRGEKYTQYVRELLKERVAAWIASNYDGTMKLQAKDLQSGDIVVEKGLLFGAKFKTVESAGLYIESPEYKALKQEDPYYHPER